MFSTTKRPPLSAGKWATPSTHVCSLVFHALQCYSYNILDGAVFDNNKFGTSGITSDFNTFVCSWNAVENSLAECELKTSSHCTVQECVADFGLKCFSEYYIIQWISLNLTPVNRTSRLLLLCHN